MSTVKNERALLRSNLLYHHWIGVDAAFIFLDGSTDGTADTARALPWVELAASASLAEMPPWARETPAGRVIRRAFGSHHTARQMLNSIIAGERARAAGCEWLIVLDPDELVCTSLETMPRDALKHFFGTLPPNVEAVQFMPLEVVPQKADTDQIPFAEATLFKNRFKVEHGLLRRRDSFRKAHSFPKTLHDPVRDLDFVTDDYHGHVCGKMAARVRAKLVPDTVHGLQGFQGRRPVTRQVGWLLHYCNATFSSFLTRFRHRNTMPAEWASGAPVDRWDRVWQGVANDDRFSEADLRAYYRRHLLVSAAEIAAWQRRAPESVREVKAVRRFFTEQSS